MSVHGGVVVCSSWDCLTLIILGFVKTHLHVILSRNLCGLMQSVLRAYIRTWSEASLQLQAAGYRLLAAGYQSTPEY